MEEPPAPQGDPPNTLPLQCVLKEDECSNLHWQDVTDKIGTSQNSRLLFLTVEYIEDVGNNQVEFNNFSPGISENDRVSPLDPNLSSSGRYSPLYNTLVIPTDGQSSFQNSVVVVPTTRNNSQISIFVDQSQVSRQLIVGEQNDFQNQPDALIENLKLEASTSPQLIVDPQSGFMTELNPERSPSVLGQKVIITTAPGFVETANSSVDAVGTNGDILGDSHAFFQNEGEKLVSPNGYVTSSTTSASDFSSPSSPGQGLLNGSETGGGKTLLDPSEYVIHSSDLKQDELLLSTSEQNNDLLMKSGGLMEVDSYNLTEETYIASEDGNSYSTMEEQLNINNIEKTDNEYLLPDTMSFEDADSNILHSNLEAFASQVLDSNGLFLYDKSKLRQNKKHLAEHLGLDYWCEECDESFDIKCRRHEVKVISDKPILSRARATLPKEHLAINKLPGDGNKEGVFARKTISKRAQFGPIEGILLKEGQGLEESSQDVVELLLEVETGQMLRLDVSDERESNWMRFVRRAKTLKEQNLILTQQGKSLYFTTTRAIPPRHELKVGYSPQYAEKRKLPVLEDLSWNCFECPMKFSSSEELQKHLNVHESEKGYDEGCNRKKSRNTIQKGVPNILRCKGNNRNRNFNDKISSTKENECLSCHKVFPRTYSLKRHLMLVHAEKDKENSGVVVKNVEDKSDKISMTNTLFKKKQSSGSGSEWLCTHCNLTFDNPSVLNLHTLTHAAEDLESEAVSGLPSELSSVYHEGEFLIENGDVQCPQCTQEFPSKRELIDHVSTHGKMTLKKIYPTNPSKPYKCDQCYKSFASDIRLQRHMLVHGSEETKPYQCDTCFKRFLNNSALSCHLKTHYDKKCFECPLCKEVFEQVFGLKEHVKIHSSDGLFTCPHCNKVFDGYSVVRKHIRAFHSGHQHICKDCGKMCPTLDKLRMHSLRHSDHREFLCANCGKQFKRKDKLKEHMKRMHSVEREMKLMSSALRIPNTKDRRFTPKMSPMAYDRFIYKCRNCMVGFKRRGMLVNHLAKRHPDIVPDTVPELNLPILKTTRDYFCQYCDKIYKSSSKRKAHILKNHPGAELPMSNRQKGGIPYIPGVPNPTFSQTVGSVKTTPHGCQWCHKQYASKAKLLQHQRKKHQSMLPQAQQIPRLARNASSPVGSEIIDSPPTPPRLGKIKSEREFEKMEDDESGQLNNQTVPGVFDINNDPDMDNGTMVDVTNYKKTIKALPENISCDLLHQAMTELSQSLSDYKLPFPGTQENLLKMIGIKDGMEGMTKEETIPAAQMTRTWPDLPPYPPR